MEKWLLWLLLETTTVLVIASLWLLWKTQKIRKESKAQQDSPTSDKSVAPHNPSGADHHNPETPFIAFAQHLEMQANNAAEKLKKLRNSDDLEQVNSFKVWGTLLKAERAIVLNDSHEDPKNILFRFLGSIISSLDILKSKKHNSANLNRTLKENDEEFIQASNTLISKEELLTNIEGLHKELRDSIARTEQKLKRMKVKNTELQHLELELSKLKEQVKKLEAHFEHESTFTIHDESAIDSNKSKHHSTRNLHQLERLSTRQQAIIEHLQAQLSNYSADEVDQKIHAHKQAIQRMERLAIESDSLIEQLQHEMESTNLSISTLKQDISEKEKQLKQLEAQLRDSDRSALNEFQTLSSSKKVALESILGSLQTFQQDSKNKTVSLSEQEREVRNLEQMLKESETCVQLLAQELESAEAENITLRERLEQVTKKRMSSQNYENLPKELAELAALREENRDLISQIQHIKDKLMSQVSDSKEKSLRNEYNKKSLELDRLQLAYSDLERKYLGTLR